MTIYPVPLSTWSEVPEFIENLSPRKCRRLARVLASISDGESAAFHHSDCRAEYTSVCICRPVTLRVGANA